MRAVVEAPHARRLVDRARHHILAVESHAHRKHGIAVPLERAHLRAHSAKEQTRARRPVSQVGSSA
eukprot:1471516-Pleurochrysis_carterae.AAC.1